MINIINDYLNGNQSTLYPQLSDWTDYTPTFTNLGTCTEIDIKWRRIGSSVEVRGSFRTGTVSASASAYFTLPSGLISDNQYTSGTGGMCGYIASDISSEGSFSPLLARNNNIVYIGGYVGYPSTYNNPLSTYGLGLLASNARQNFYLSVPIQGWSALGTTNLSELPNQLSLCKAWGNFQYSGSLVINSSYNCTISRTSQGVYQVTFTNPMTDANYSVNVSRAGSGHGNDVRHVEIAPGQTINSFSIYTGYIQQQGDTYPHLFPEDAGVTFFQVFGN